MPIITTDGKRLLFIHVPKTGGSAVEKYFSSIGTVSFEKTRNEAIDTPCIPRHYHGEMLSNLFPQKSFDYVFMIVRDPVARIVSEYRYLAQRKRRGVNPLNFAIWLRYRLWRTSRDPFYKDNHFRPQHEFECLDARVFRYEDGLDHILAEVAKEARLSIPTGAIERVNVSPQVPVWPSAGDTALIRNRYHVDCERYGYLPKGVRRS